jgi:NTP pyrophosphatase (non-canonical NTP hydrolase)
MTEKQKESIARVGMDTLQLMIREWSVAKGWRDLAAEPRNAGELIALCHSELSEALEAFRHGNPACERPGMKHLSHAEEELADCVIRIVQMADEYGFDLAEAIVAKMRFNWTRPPKHGKAF